MKLTKRIEYAIAGLYFLAYVRPQQYVQVRTIAEEIDIPKRFLEQIFLTLREHRLLDSKRGSHGGYRVIADITQLTLGQMFDILEPANTTSPPAYHCGAGTYVINAQTAVKEAMHAIHLDSLVTDDLLAELEGARTSTMYYI